MYQVLESHPSMQDPRVKDLFRVIGIYRDRWALQTECWGEAGTPQLADCDTGRADLAMDKKLANNKLEMECYDECVAEPGATAPEPEAASGSGDTPKGGRLSKMKKKKSKSATSLGRSNTTSSVAESADGTMASETPSEMGAGKVDGALDGEAPSNAEALPLEAATPTPGLPALAPMPHCNEVMTPEEQEELRDLNEKIAALEKEAARQVGFHPSISQMLCFVAIGYHAKNPVFT